MARAVSVASFAASLRLERAPRRDLDADLLYVYVFCEVDRCPYCRERRSRLPGAVACVQCLPRVESAHRVRQLGEVLLAPRPAEADGILVGSAESGWVAVRVVTT